MTKISLLNRIFVLLLLTSILISCSKDEAEVVPPTTTITLSEKSKTLVQSDAKFGYNVFAKIVASDDKNKNFMISPLSINQALSMALNGAGGNTYLQMQSTMQFDNLSIAEINQSNFDLVSELVKHDPKVELSISNSVWYNSRLRIKQNFIDVNKNSYNAEVASFDASKTQEAKQLMNNWVKAQTKGKIEEIIDEVDPMSAAFLINAVYFNAKWKVRFDESKTANREFKLSNGTQIMVPTMEVEAPISVRNTTNFTAIKLPYGTGKFNMVVYLPNTGKTLSDIYSEIETADLSFESGSSANLPSRKVRLPKFEFEYKNELNDELFGLGMNDAFDPSLANFSQLSLDEIYITKVNHKTYIKTDEAGSEAAAATSVEFMFSSAGPQEMIEINRPFIFTIIEEDTKAILFMGQVINPLTK